MQQCFNEVIEGRLYSSDCNAPKARTNVTMELYLKQLSGVVCQD
jgi:hypothetical protein